MEKLESVPALVVGLRRGPHVFLILKVNQIKKIFLHVNNK